MAAAALLRAALALLLLAAAPATASARQGAVDGPVASPGSLAARSLVVPGWGQRAQGQGRALAYAVAEAALWIFWADRRGRGGDLRNDYQDLAWETARGARGIRVDGAWSYYENLSKWRRSGAFDQEASAPGIQPEEDPSTFNGSTWQLARDLYFGGRSAAPGDPAYQAALAWYAEHAYGEAFLWDWTGLEPAQDRFRDLIHGSDERFREATTVLGAVLANHLLSAVDAFVSAQVPGVVESRLAPAGPRAPPGLTLEVGWRPPR